MLSLLPRPVSEYLWYFLVSIYLSITEEKREEQTRTMIFIFLALLLLVALFIKFLTSDGMYTGIIRIHLHVNCELTICF